MKTSIYSSEKIMVLSSIHKSLTNKLMQLQPVYVRIAKTTQYTLLIHQNIYASRCIWWPQANVYM